LRSGQGDNHAGSSKGKQMWLNLFTLVFFSLLALH
jgi:hypothetical protein